MPAYQTTAESVVLHSNEGERVSFGGFEIVFKSPTEYCNGNWTVLDCTLPAGQFGAPLHYDRELIESFYVLSGELWMRVGDEELTATPGTIALIQPGTVHSFANRSDAPARFLGYASSPQHKAFLQELFDMARSERSWPPSDVMKIVELGQLYDTVYV